jgi:NAD-dependent dihydropyrimidine dehydrogenase PreA subunit
MFALRYIPDVATLALDVEACIGCGRCTEVCPHAVFVVEDRKARIVDLDACMECGACAVNCPADALTVKAGVGCAAAILRGGGKCNESCCASSDEAPCCSTNAETD